MKSLVIPGIAIIFSLITFSGSVHDYSVPKIEGGNQSLSAFAGKKILIITLPIQQNATADSMLFSLDTLAYSRISTLKVIAVPSFEDGYTNAQKIILEQWYRTKLGNHIIITKGLHTRKSSGVQQHPLFRWLTNANQNGIFDIDVEGPGHKYFSKRNGQLYGVLIPPSKISGQSVQKTLQMQ